MDTPTSYAARKKWIKMGNRMNLFLYYGYITEMQFNIIFCSRHVNTPFRMNKDKTEEDILHDLNKCTPAVGKLIKEFNLEL